MTPRRTIWIGCACGHTAMLASQRHPKCLPMIRAAQARRESRIFRIVSTRPIFIRTGFGSVPRETATMFLSTSAPGVSFQYEYNVPLEFKFICAPIEGACDGRYLLVRSSNYIFLRSINFDLAKRSCTDERRPRTAGANEVAGLRQWAGWYQATRQPSEGRGEDEVFGQCSADVCGLPTQLDVLGKHPRIPRAAKQISDAGLSKGSVGQVADVAVSAVLGGDDRQAGLQGSDSAGCHCESGLGYL